MRTHTPTHSVDEVIQGVMQRVAESGATGGVGGLGGLGADVPAKQSAVLSSSPTTGALGEVLAKLWLLKGRVDVALDIYLQQRSPRVFDLLDDNAKLLYTLTLDLEAARGRSAEKTAWVGAKVSWEGKTGGRGFLVSVL